MIIVDTNVVSELMRPSRGASRRKELFASTADEMFAAFDEYMLPFDRAAAIHYATIVSAVVGSDWRRVEGEGALPARTVGQPRP